MCDPISIGALTALTIASTAVSATGAVVAGISQSNQAKYQAAVARQNQHLAENAATDALERGRIAERDQYRRNAAVQGEQRAAQAANGIEIGFGSALSLQQDSAMLGADDARTVRQNAVREAQSYSINASNYGSQAAAAKSASTGALIGTAFSLGSTILGGATQVTKYQQEARMNGGYG